MSIKSKYITNLLATLSAGLLISACGGGDKKDTSAHAEKATVSKGQNITFCLPSVGAKIEAGANTDAASITPLRMGFEGLLGFEKASAEARSVLAESYDVSDDNLSYTFHLRHGVKFHHNDKFTPSRDMNADDVVFSFMRQIDTNSPFYHNDYTYIRGTGIDKVIDSIEKIDDYTVKFVLKHPMATFIPNILVSHVFGIVPKEYYEKMKAAGDLDYVYNHPIGTGPWQFKSAKTDEAVRFTAHKEYWGGVPKAERVVIKAIPNVSQYLNAVETGECDITYKIQPADVKNVVNYKNVALMPTADLVTAYLIVNFEQLPEYNNPLVMQALAYGINKQAIVDDAYGGNAEPASSLIPPGMFGHMSEYINQYDYNPEKAKELLAKAGHANGKGLHKFTYHVASGRPSARNTALVIQSDLKKLGIQMDIRELERSTLNTNVSKHNFQVTGSLWGADFPDPDNFYSNILGDYGTAVNHSSWKNKEFHKLRTQATVVSDPEQRKKLYVKLTKVMAKYMPIIPLIYMKSYVSLNKNVHGYYTGPMDNTDALMYVTKD